MPVGGPRPEATAATAAFKEPVPPFLPCPVEDHKCSQVLNWVVLRWASAAELGPRALQGQPHWNHLERCGSSGYRAFRVLRITAREDQLLGLLVAHSMVHGRCDPLQVCSRQLRCLHTHTGTCAQAHARARTPLHRCACTYMRARAHTYPGFPRRPQQLPVRSSGTTSMPAEVPQPGSWAAAGCPLCRGGTCRLDHK